MEGAVERNKIKHPVFMDNDYAYWKALGNRFWPSFYLVDKQGFFQRVGEGVMIEGRKETRRIEEEIARLLAEPAKD